MRRACRQLPPIAPREEDLIHVTWLLSCLESGFVLELPEKLFRRVFGSPQDATRLHEAEEFSRRRGCQFAYRLEDRVATFRRVDARGYAADF